MIDFLATVRGGPAGIARRLRTGRPWRWSPWMVLMQAALAPALALLAADRLSAKDPVLAPLTSLLVVQTSLYETLSSGAQRVASVVAGVLLAVLLSSAVSLSWWSLGLAVLASLVIGRRLRLGSQLLEMPVSAMLVLAVSSHPEVAARTRVYETLIGAAVGVLVKAVLPPVDLHSGRDAVLALGQRIGGVLTDLGAGLERGDGQLGGRAGGMAELPRAVADTHDALARVAESLRLNPRRRRVEPVTERLRAATDALEQVSVHVRMVGRWLDQGAGLPAGRGIDRADIRAPLALLLEAAAEAVSEFVRLASADGAAVHSWPLHQALDQGYAQLDTLAGRPPLEAADRAWQAHATLLPHLHGLLHELDPQTERAALAAGPPGHGWGPRRQRGRRRTAALRG